MPGTWPAAPEGRDLFWRLVDVCERTEIDSIWFSERLSSPLPVLEPMIAMAAVAARTRGLKFGPSASRRVRAATVAKARTEEHTSELQSNHEHVCRPLLEKKKTGHSYSTHNESV